MPETIKIAEMEKNFDHYMDRCESGETFFIEQEDGRLVAMVPADEYGEAINDLNADLSIYKNHNDAS